MHHWTIYMYTFPNGKRYVGATMQRLHARQGKDWNRYKLCRLLWPAIQEFGVDNIKTDILFKGYITDEEAGALEQHYIALYKTNASRYQNPSYGYNLGDGGEGLHNRQISEERKEVLRAQMEILRAQNQQRPVSEETRRRISEGNKGRIAGPMSEETKAKISKANSRENMTWETHIRRSKASKRPVLMVDDFGNKTIFESREAVAKHFGVCFSMPTRWISGERKPPAGFHFYDYSPTTTERGGLCAAQ